MRVQAWRSTSRRRRNVLTRTCVHRQSQTGYVTPRVSPLRKGEQRHIYSPTTSPRQKRRRVVQGRDPSEPDDDDDESEVVVDTPQRAPKAKPQPQPKYKPRRSSEQHSALTPPPVVPASLLVNTSSPSSSPPPSPPDVNSLTTLPLPSLPAPACWDLGAAAQTESSANVAQSFGQQCIANNTMASNAAGFFAVRGPQPSRTVSSQKHSRRVIFWEVLRCLSVPCNQTVQISSTVLPPGQLFANIALAGQIASVFTRTLRKRTFFVGDARLPTSSHFARTPIPPRLIPPQAPILPQKSTSRV